MRRGSVDGAWAVTLNEQAGMVHRYESLLGFTVAGDRSSVMAATKIVELLEELGHEVLTRHLIREDAWQADRSISPQEVYLRDMTWLERCDSVCG